MRAAYAFRYPLKASLRIKSVFKNMKDLDYSKQLKLFIAEIVDKGIDEFKRQEEWTLSTDTLNGVLIGYELPTKSSRTLLHQIGQKHGLTSIVSRRYD